MSTEHAHAEHTHAHPAPVSGFKYFVPGLIVGFVMGAVFGTLAAVYWDRGGPDALVPPSDTTPRVHDESERMREGAIPQDEEQPTLSDPEADEAAAGEPRAE